MPKNNIVIIGIIGLLVIVAIFFRYNNTSSPVQMSPYETINEMNNEIVGKTPVPTGETAKTEKAPIMDLKTPKTTTLTPKTPSSSVPQKTSRVVFAITDEAIALDNLESIRMTINEVSIYSATKGWFTVMKSPREFDLLSLYKNSGFEVITDLDVDIGTYNQMRFGISKVFVTEKGSGFAKEAKLPSSELKFVSNLVVENGKPSGMIVDFLSDKSLHTTGSGDILFLPVLKVNSQSNIATVQIARGSVQFIDGRVDFDATIGMDENGMMKSGFSFDSATKFELVGSVLRIIPRDEKSSNIKFDAEAAVDAVIKSQYVDIALSIKTTMRNDKLVWKIVGTKQLAIKTIYVDITTGALIAVE